MGERLRAVNRRLRRQKHCPAYFLYKKQYSEWPSNPSKYRNKNKSGDIILIQQSGTLAVWWVPTVCPFNSWWLQWQTIWFHYQLHQHSLSTILKKTQATVFFYFCLYNGGFQLARYFFLNILRVFIHFSVTIMVLIGLCHHSTEVYFDSSIGIAQAERVCNLDYAGNILQFGIILLIKSTSTTENTVVKLMVFQSLSGFHMSKKTTSVMLP